MTVTETADHALAASFQQTRTPLVAREGMVAAGHPLASAAGLDALRKGGNAMDAAVAAALATAVVMPAMAGLGADAFFIHADGKTGEVTALNSSGIAPRALSREYFVSRDYTQMPFYGPLSIGVPGAVDAFFVAIERWCRLSPAELFSYAIHYAEHGFPLSVVGSRIIAASADQLAKDPGAAAILLRDGRALQPGDFLVNPNLAQSLRIVAEGGPEVFYRGSMAKRIAEGIQAVGGELTADDMAGHASHVYSPIATTYRGATVYQTTLPTQGHIMLEELNIVENVDLAGLGPDSPAALHLLIEAKKRAFADRNAYSRDPEFGPVPLDTLISKPFARERFASIDMNHATDKVAPGALPEHVGDTTYLCAADGDGNMVSWIHSLSAGFGSHVVAGDTGILLNNRVGRGFTLDPTHPNVIESGKRTMHTLNCYALARDGQVVLVGGTPGGDGQPQWNMQVVTNMLDYGMDVQAAVEAPRWLSFPGTDPINIHNPFQVRLESRIPQATIEDLRARGHVVSVVGPFAGGGAAFVIARNPATGVLEAGADPRSEGLALGL